VAEATTPAPLPTSESDDRTHSTISGTIPGDRPEFPLPTLDAKHSFLAAPGGIDRPRTPPELSFEDSRALLTRLTGLQPWQLEAFPDELPPLPLSRPSSPLRSPEQVRPALTPIARRLSSTAVPIRFRKPGSAEGQRDLTAEQPPVPPVQTSPARSRHVKAQSAEFKTSREIRPLYLLERIRKPEQVDELLPALPSSGSPSRTSSTTETDTEYESALESPGLSASMVSDHAFFDPLPDLASLQPGPELHHPELLDREIEEVDDSGQATPKASAFTAGGSAGPAYDVLASALEDARVKSVDASPNEVVVPESSLEPSAPLDDSLMRDVVTDRVEEASRPTSSKLQDTVLGAMVEGFAAAALRDRSPSPSEPKPAQEMDSKTDNAHAHVESGPVLSRKDNNGNGKAMKKARGKKMSTSESSLPTPVEETLDVLPTPAYQAFVPTFNDNEDDWVKNTSKSVVTDDATLVGEPPVGQSTSKELQREKVLESTAPHGDQDTGVLRALIDNGSDRSSAVDVDVRSDKDMTSTPTPLSIPTEDMENALSQIAPASPARLPLEDQEPATTPKGKKTKKNKKGKRGSQLIEYESSKQPALEEHVVPVPKTQLENQILEPAFAPTEREDLIAPESFPAIEDSARDEANLESQSRSVPVESEILKLVYAKTGGKDIAHAEEVVETPAKPLPVPTESEEAEQSGWGTSLWGALGWGKKKTASRPVTPETQHKPVSEKREEKEQKEEVLVPPAPVVSAEPESGTPAFVAPRTAYFADDGKPAFAFPPRFAIGTRDAPTQEVADFGDDAPILKKEVTPVFVTPTTAYFADDGKPAFTYPPTSTIGNKATPTPDVTDLGDDVPVVTREMEPVSVTPPIAYFTDDGKPAFAFPSVFTTKTKDEPVQDNTDPAPDAPVELEKTSSAFVAPQVAYFADDGKPAFSFPPIPTQSAEQVLDRSAVTDDTKPIDIANVATEVVEQETAAESTSSKKKKTKKDKKKRGSVVTPEVIEAEAVAVAEDTTTTKPSTQEPETLIQETTSSAPAFQVGVAEPQLDLAPENIALPVETLSMDETTTATPELESSLGEPRGIALDVPPEVAQESRKPPRDDAPLDEPVNLPESVHVAAPPVVEEVAPSSSKKKTKKAKKAKRESVQVSTPDVSEPSTPLIERSFDEPAARSINTEFDVGVDVPLPAESFGEREELMEPVVEVQDEAVPPVQVVEEIMPEPSTFPLPIATEQEQEELLEPMVEPSASISTPTKPESSATITEAAPTSESIDRESMFPEAPEAAPAVAEDVTGTPKKKGKKAKKSKAKSGTQTPEPQASAVLEPSAPVSEPLATPEEMPELPKDSEVTVPDFVDAPAPEAKQTEDFEMPSAQDKSLEDPQAPMDQNIPAEPVAVPVEPEVPSKQIPPPTMQAPEDDTAAPSSKKGKKRKVKKAQGTETPVEATTPLEQQAPDTEAVVEEVTKPVYEAEMLLSTVEDAKPEDMQLPEMDREEELQLSVDQIPEKDQAVDVQVPDLEENVVLFKDDPVLPPADPVTEPAMMAIIESAEDVSIPAQPSTEVSVPTGEQLLPAIFPPTETAAEDEWASPASSKKDKKKKKGKKTKAEPETEPDTPVSEVQRELEVPEIPAQSEITVETAGTSEERSFEEPSQLELPITPVTVNEINPESSQSGPISDAVAPEPTSLVEEPSLPATPVEVEAVRSSKKLKKTKKGKNGKTVEDSEPSTPATEVQRELGSIVEPTEPETSAVSSVLPQDQAVDTPKHVEEPSVGVDTPEEVAPEVFSQAAPAVPDDPILRDDEVAESSQSPTPILDEPASAKKSKKKKGKKGKTVGDEGITLEQTDAVVAPEVFVHPTVTEPDVEPTEEPQSVALPPATSGEQYSELQGVFTPALNEPAIDAAPVQPTEDAHEVPLPAETPGELISEPILDVIDATDVAAAHLKEPDRDTPELSVDGQQALPLKKGKKKKGKKTQSVDVQPTTSGIEETNTDLGTTPESSSVDRTIDTPVTTTDAPLDVSLEPTQVRLPEPTLDEETLGLQDVPAPEAFAPADDATPSEPAQVPLPEPTQDEELTEDTTTLVSEAPAVTVAESASTEEPTTISKKSKKKKKAKKDVSLDTEPSTPTVEEPALRLEEVVEPESIHNTVQPSEDVPSAESSAPLPSSEPVLVEEIVDVAPIAQDTAVSTVVEAASEDVSVASSLKKKKKGKKSKAAELNTPLEEQPVSEVEAPEVSALREKSVDDMKAVDVVVDVQSSPIIIVAEQDVLDGPEPAVVEPAEEISMPADVQSPSIPTTAEQDIVDGPEPAVVEPAEEISLPAASPEISVEDQSASTSKKGKKKKKNKKASASDSLETETAAGSAERDFAMEATSDGKPTDDTRVAATLPTDAPIDREVPDSDALPTASMELPVERELENGQPSEPVSFEKPLEASTVDNDMPLETPLPTESETPQPREPAVVEDAAPTTKKGKKKKGKKGASVSEPQTPITEPESFIPPADVPLALETIDTPADVSLDRVISPRVKPDTALPQNGDQGVETFVDEPTIAVQPSEVKSEGTDTQATAESVSNEAEKQIPSDPISKKSKKKGKKNKTTELESETPDVPSTTVEELPKVLEQLVAAPQVVSETQEDAAGVPLPEELDTSQLDRPTEEPVLTETHEPSVPEPVVEPFVEQASTTTNSKKDKKKAKKDKRASIVDAPSTPATPVEELSKEVEGPILEEPIEVDSQEIAAAVPLPEESMISAPASPKSAPAEALAVPTTSAEDREIPQLSSSNDSASIANDLSAPVEQVEDLSHEPTPTQDVEAESVTSKKNKKKAKKGKLASVLESESSTPLETPAEELRVSPLDMESAPVADVAITANHEAISTSVDVQPAVGPETIEPATALVAPAEIITQAPLEVEPAPIPETLSESKEDAVSTSIDIQPTTAPEPPANLTTISEMIQQPEQAPEDDSAPISKSAKKKGKKAKRVSIVEPPSSPATPLEEQKELELPVVEDPVATPVIPEEPVSDALPVDEPASTLQAVEQTALEIAPEAESTSKSKKKGKKAKRGSVVESGTSTPIETLVNESTANPLNQSVVQTAPVAESRSIPVFVNDVTKDLGEESLALDDGQVTGFTDSGLVNVESAAVEPTIVEPTIVEPTIVEPTIVEPSTVQPPTVEPTAVKPTIVEPSTVQSPTVEPSAVEPTAASSEEQEAPVVSPAGEAPQDDTSATWSKKGKKKAKKAAKQASNAEPEPSEPIVPVEQPIEVPKEITINNGPSETPLTHGDPAVIVRNDEQPAVAPEVVPEPSIPITATIEGPRDVVTEDLPTVTPLSAEELSVAPATADLPVMSSVAATIPGPVEDQAPDEAASSSKKIKKKKKKAKDASTEEEALSPLPAVLDDELALPTADVESAPLQAETEPVIGPSVEEVSTHSINEQPSTAPLPGPASTSRIDDVEAPTTSTPQAQAMEDEAEPAEWASLSKSQKKKLKKAKRGSIAESEPSQPSTPAEELLRELAVVEEAPAASTLDEATTEPRLSAAPVVAEPLSVVEEATVDEESTVVVEAPEVDTPSAIAQPGVHESPSVSQEPTLEAPVARDGDAGPVVSKKGKKKAKKAKGQSETSQPATPAEELSKELTLDEQPSATATTEGIPSEPPPANDTPPPDLAADEPIAAQAPADEQAPTSKKGKKKGKQQSKIESVPLKAEETPEPANSDTRTSPSPSIHSETHSLLSGIPTSYPQFVRDDEFAVTGGENERGAMEEAARDVEPTVVDEEEMEREVHVDPQVVVPSEVQEPVRKGVNVATSKKEKKSKKGKKETLVTEETVTDGALPVEAPHEGVPEPVTAQEQHEPATEVEIAEPQDLLQDIPVTEAEIPDVPLPIPTPMEESKLVESGLDTTVIAQPTEANDNPADVPTTPKKSKKKAGNIGKLAAMFEQSVPVDAHISLRERTFGAKQAPKFGLLELPRELPESSVNAAPEPVVVSDTPPTIKGESTGISEAAVEEPLQQEPHKIDGVAEAAAENEFPVLEQLVPTPTEILQPEAVEPDATSSVPTKKDKKKGKKNKKQSGTTTPTESVTEAQATPFEEPAVSLIEETSTNVTEHDLPFFVQGSVAEPSSGAVALDEVVALEVQQDKDDDVAPTQVEQAITEIKLESEVVQQPELPVSDAAEMANELQAAEIQPLVNESPATLPAQDDVQQAIPEGVSTEQLAEQESGATPSKKDKKDKRRKKSGLTDPVVDSQPQEEPASVPATEATDQFERATVVENAPVAPSLEIAASTPLPSTTVPEVVFKDELDLTTVERNVAEVPAVGDNETLQNFAPVIEPSTLLDDASIQPSKKDKKKAKKTKKSGADTPTGNFPSPVPAQEEDFPVAPSAPVTEAQDDIPVGFDTVTVPDSSTADILQIELLPEATLPEPKVEDRLREATESILVPGATITDGADPATPDPEPQSLVEETPIASSKKDKKKSKKAKKASVTATPVTQNFPEALSEAPREIEIVEPVSSDVVTQEVPHVPVEQVGEQNQVEEVATPSMVDLEPTVDDGTLPASYKEPVAKEKRQIEAVATPSMVEPEPLVEDAAVSASSKEPLVEEERQPEAVTTTSVLDPAPSVDDAAPPISSKKKNKKKAKKSGTVTPAIEVSVEPEPESVREFDVTAPTEGEAALGDVPIAPAPDALLVEAKSEMEQAAETPLPIDEPTVVAPTGAQPVVALTSDPEPESEAPASVQEPALESVVEDTALPTNSNTPAEQSQDFEQIDTAILPVPKTIEPTVDNGSLSSSTKRKGKKKGKKSEPAALATEDASSLQSTGTHDSGNVLHTELGVEAPTQPVAEEPTSTQEKPSTAQPTLAKESDLPPPAEHVAEVEPPLEQVAMVEEPIIVGEPIHEESTFPPSKKKGKKSKAKKSAPHIPALEIDDPIVAEASGPPEDLLQAPVAAVEVEGRALDIAPIDDTPRTEEVVESVDVEQPILTKRSTIDESSVEVESLVKEVLAHSQPAPKFAETLNAGETSQTALKDQPHSVLPIKFVDTESILDEPAQVDPLMDNASSIPINEGPGEIASRDESAPTPKKGKKAKKDKKSRKQSESLEDAAEIDNQPSVVLEQASEVIEPQTETTVVEPAPIAEPTDTKDLGLLSSIGNAAKSLLPSVFQTSDSSAAATVDTEYVAEQPHEYDNTPQKDVTTEQLEVFEEPKVDDIVTSVAPVVAETGSAPAVATIADDEQPPAPIPLEPAEQALPLDTTPVHVQPDAPVLVESTERELLIGSVPTTLPDAEPIIDSLVQPADVDQALHLSTSASIKPDEAEDSGFVATTKQSKKDKKKAKKSKSTSEDAPTTELTLEPTILAEVDKSESAEPIATEESSRDVRTEEPQHASADLPSVVQPLSESLSTPAANSMSQAHPEVPETSQIYEIQPIATETREISAPQFTSKKTKKKKGKKGQKAVEDVGDEPSVPLTPIIETLPVLEDASLEQVPTSTAEIVESEHEQASVAPMQESRDIEATQPESVPAVIEPRVDTVHGIVEPTPKADQPQEEIVAPPELSPTLKSIQDEAVELKLRSEALDQILASNEPLDLTQPPQPISFFDVASKLSKKEKKKGKGSALKSEPTTPAPESEVAVETKDVVEEPITAVETQQPAVELPQDQIADSNLPTVDERTVERELASTSVEEVAQAPTQETGDIVNSVPLLASNEPQDASTEEQRPSSSRKLSKKDKKKGKQAIVPEILPEAEFAVPHTRDQLQEVMPADEPAPGPVIVEPAVSTDAPDSQPAVVDEEQRPSLSRKLSKKEKKKHAKTTALAQEIVVSETTEAISRKTVDQSVTVGVLPPVEDQHDVRMEKPSSVSREPEHIVEDSSDLPVSSERDLPMEEATVEPTPFESLSATHNPQATMSLDDVPAVPASRDETTTIADHVLPIEKSETTTESEQVTMVDIPSHPIHQEITIEQTEALVPDVSSSMDTSALLRKQSTKDKKKGKKKAVVEDVVESERSVDIEMTEGTQAPDLPILQEPVSTERSSVQDTEQEIIRDALPANLTFFEPHKSIHAEAQPPELVEELVSVQSPLKGPEVDSTKSKKPKEKKRRSKGVVALQDEPLETSRPILPTEELPGSSVVPDTVIIDRPDVEAEDESALLPKKSKNDKRKSKTTAKSDESDAPIAPEPSRDEMVQIATEEPSIAFPTVEVIADACNMREVVQDSAPVLAPLHADGLAAPEQRTLARKASKTHKLAALFESGASRDGAASDRELRRGGTGSVKNLAEQFEGQSRSVTPILQLSSEKHSTSRVGALADRNHSKSPQTDIDFAATVAAGLKESGFNENYVVNDPTFSRSTSAMGVRDTAPDDEIAAAKDSASASKFATRGWTTPTASPKLRPTQETLSEALPPIEVAMAPTDNISFDPLDVLNDPTFMRRKTPPGVLEEGDPDELGSSLKANKKPKGKKKRTSVVEAPTETSTIEVVPTFHHDKQIESSCTSRHVSKEVAPAEEITTTLLDQPHTVISDGIQSTTFEEIQADSWSAIPAKKEKKTKNDKKRASIARDNVEYTAAETPAVEAFTNVHPAVEIPVDSTVRDVESEEPFPAFVGTVPSNVIGVPVTAPSITAGEEPKEYPFPQVPILQSQAAREVVEQMVQPEYEHQKELEDSVTVSRKKGKKSRRGKEVVDAIVDREKEEDPERHDPTNVVQDNSRYIDRDVTHEAHKRRSHPVLVHEDQPLEKRLHVQEETSDDTFEPTSRGPNPIIDPTWSFRDVQDSGYHDADDILQQASSETIEVSPREKKRRSKEPKTPRERAIHNSSKHSIDPESPSLPGHPNMPDIATPDHASKERTSYLFDSSPQTPTHNSHTATMSSTKETNETPRSIKSSRTESRQERSVQTNEIKQAEPHKSIFGDPSDKNTVPTAATSQHGRTPSNKQLDTITEASPDDSPLHKKSQAITDIGAPERGVKSARRSETPKSFSERLNSPSPITPTPSRHQAASPAFEASGRKTPSKDSPWTQVHESVDRTMTLSPARRLPRSSPSFDPIKQHMAEQRSPSVASQRSMSNISKLRSPDQERPLSSMSTHSSQSLRRVDRSTSGDLRNAARLGGANAQDANSAEPNLSGIAPAASATAAVAAIAAASRYDPVRGEGKGRRASMAAETFVSVQSDATLHGMLTVFQEAYGEAQSSPMSPTRPPSVRKRQSMQIMDLQSHIDQLAAHNQSLEDARARAEETLQATQHQRQIDEQLVAEATEARDREIHQRDIDIAQLKDTLQRLREEIGRLTELNNTLKEANHNLTNDANERYAQLQSEGQLVHQQWQTSQNELEKMRKKHEQMSRGMADVVRDEIGIALDDRNAEIDRLNAELASAKEQVKTLQKQILATKKPGESFLVVRDEDYFDSACQQLCQHVQQWVLRFSKFSDTRPCRLSSEIAADTRIDTATRQKIDTRLDNAILDGSDVDSLLADRVKRRDVFMSVVMTMIWEYVFTRYLFGMDREQRQKLKSLEKTLSEVGKCIEGTLPSLFSNKASGPPRAVAQWRAITLTLLSKREPFMQQRAQDTEAVVHEIYTTLSTLLAPPSHLQAKVQDSLKNVMHLAVELSIEMRTQRAEYIMLPPLQPEYDTNGDLLAKVSFNASLMNERSGETTSNDELESRKAIVKIVLFPLVVKKGDDFGEGEDEIVVCPAQVLVARPRDKKVVRMLSGAMSIDRPNSRASRMTSIAPSVLPESSVMDLSGGGGNVI
jgi:hypothetical protein